MSKEKSAPSLKKKLQNAGLHIEEVDGVKTLYDGEGDPICQDDLQDQIEAIEDEIGEVGESGTIRDDIDKRIPKTIPTTGLTVDGGIISFSNYTIFHKRMAVRAAKTEPGFQRHFQDLSLSSGENEGIIWDAADSALTKFAKMAVTTDATTQKRRIVVRVLNSDNSTWKEVTLIESD